MSKIDQQKFINNELLLKIAKQDDDISKLN